MTQKPTYEELEQRVRTLENDLAAHKSLNGDVLLREQYLKAILDNTNLPIYLKDADYKYILVNHQYERLANVTSDQIRGKDDFAVFPEPIARLFRDQDEEVVQRKSLVEFTETIQLADGEHTFITAKFPLIDTQGSVYAVGGVCTDITSLEKAQKELAESEHRYRSFVKNFHGIAYRGEIHSYVPVFFDGAVEKITGYTEQDFLAGTPTWNQVVHPDDLHILHEDGKRMQQLPPYTLRREYRIVRKDGAVRWIFERGQTLCDDQGQPFWLEGSLFDITGRKEIETSLRESEEKYRLLFTNEIDAITIFDINTGQILDVNDAFLKLYGYSREEVLQLTAQDMSAEPEKTREAIKKSADQGDVLIPIRKHKKKDGTRITVQLSAGPFTWKGQAVMYAVIRDITQQMNAEKALRASENKFISVLESCPEGIHMYTLQPDGRLIFTGSNPAADAILKIDHSRLVGLGIEEAFPGSTGTEIPERYREVCRSGKSWQTQQFMYKDDRIEGAFEVHAFQTKPGSMATFFQDITAKRRMEEELQKIQKLESVGILAGGIAHDFNNLLTAILGNISMAKLFAQTDQAKVGERLADAENASLRARDLTQQLLTFSKGGAPVKSTALIDEVIKDSTSFMLSGSNVKCNLEISDDVWPVDIDVGQISQVIQNVVKNADQAMPEGGTITITSSNVLVDETADSPLRPGRYVHISIADQGVGIPQKHLAKVFDPYFSTKQEGSGLGLAASFSIIKNHNGLMTAESGYGTGTTFHIYLPASSKKPVVKVAQQKKLLRSGEYILVMDDDDDVLNVAVNMLNIMGYKTDIARDGTEALTKYNQANQSGQPFDGVLLDLTIPGGMGGRETMQQLAKLDPEVKAIVSSGYANDPIMADYATHGFKGVVIKPYDMEQLGQVLRNLFD